VFEHSWRLLSEDEAAALARCSVFQGGFTPDAGRAICDVDQRTLAALVAKSLLNRSGTDRYSMHTLVRQFAAERLALDQPAHAAMLDRHCSFFIDWLTRLGENIGDDPGHYRAALADLDNIRAAWNRAVSELCSPKLGMAVRGLSQLYYQCGLFQEAEKVFGQAAERLHGATDAVSQEALGRVLLELSYFAERLGRSEDAVHMAREAIALGERIGSAYLQAGGLLRLAGITWGTGRDTDVRILSEQGLAMARLAKDRRLEIIGLAGLALDLDRRGEHAQAIALDESALELARAEGNRRLAGIIAGNLGKIWEAHGDFVRAYSCFEQALNLQREIEDRMGIAVTQSALGRVALTLGDTAGAQEQLAAALLVLEEVGERFRLCDVLTSRALLRQQQGDLVRALEASQQAADLARAGQLHGRLIEAMLIQGRILAALDRAPEARARYGQVVDLAAEIQDASLDVPARAGLADLYLAAGEVLNALAEVEHILPALPAMPLDALADPFRAYLTCYRVLAAAGDARAQDVARAAQTHLRDLADQITDPAMRWRFLEQVPSNRNVMLLLTA
jgi:tetratricopeptide (TPR) repeat protein